MSDVRVASEPAADSPVPVEERLFSLVLALVATEQGLTKPQILSTVQGYRQRFRHGGDNSSLERQFERDKDDIRELGIPLDTVHDDADPDDNHNLRYRIPKGDYDLPEDLRFTAEEFTLLGLAATVWREGSLSAQSRRAIMKLRSLGIDAEEPVLGYAPRIRARESSFDPLNQALDRHTVVTFPYLKPGEQDSQRRTLAPLALVQHQGRWHVHGIDQDAHAPRTFLLNRIVGPVRTTGRRFEPEGENHAAHALEELDRLWSMNVAVVQVTPKTDAAARLRRIRGAAPTPAPTPTASQQPADMELSLHYTDEAILADELSAFGPEVLVISPPSLREAVRRRLLAVAAAHGGVTA